MFFMTAPHRPFKYIHQLVTAVSQMSPAAEASGADRTTPEGMIPAVRRKLE